MDRTHILIAAVVVSLVAGASFVSGTWVASRAYLRRGEQQEHVTRTLSVTGSARKPIVSDLAQWSILVSGEGKSVEEAFQKMASAGDRVREFLSQKGFAPETVYSGPINTITHYRRDPMGHETREILSYRLSRTFEIRTDDVRKVEKVSGEVTELLKTGAQVVSQAPEFIFTKLSDLKIVVIGEATANARERADRIARESGCAVTTVKDARAGVLQITRPWSTEATSSGVNDTTSVEKEVSAVVHLSMLIAPR